MPVFRQDERLRAKVAALLISAIALSGCAALTGDSAPGLTGVGNGDVAARAGDAVVTVDELADEVAVAVAGGALANEQFTGSDVEREIQLQTLVLNNLLAVALVETAAADEFDIEVTEADVDERIAVVAEDFGGMDGLQAELEAAGQSMEGLRESERVNGLVERVTEALLDSEPLTDEDVRAEYEARAGQFEQVEASHVLVPTQAEAEDVIARLDAGEDFADVATEVSQDPGSAANGGSLGLSPRGSYVPEFEAAIWDGPATPGEILGPVETQFGFHVIRVDEFVITPEDEAIEQVRTDLESGRGQDLFGFWLRQLRSDADVEVAGRFGRWSVTDQAIVRDDAPAPQQ